MSNENMIHMANQIALFFSGYPHQEAVAGVLDHIVKFWEKRMKAQLKAYIASGGTGLHSLVVEAAQQLG